MKTILNNRSDLLETSVSKGEEKHVEKCGLKESSKGRLVTLVIIENKTTVLHLWTISKDATEREARTC